MSIRVFVIEDDLRTCEELARSITTSDQCEFLGYSQSVLKARRLIRRIAADVIILDLNLPDGEGIEMIPDIRRYCPECEILVYTFHDDGKHLVAALESGATGYLIKPATDGELVHAILQICDGGSPISPSIARRLIARFRKKGEHKTRLEELTKRELEVLSLVASGMYDKEIAHKLGVSTRTVNTHVRNIYLKLHVNSRTEAAAIYHRAEDPLDELG